jgi:hypothetical protein
MDFTSGGNSKYLAHLCDGADVVMVQEAKDFRLADALPDGWYALQDSSSEAKAGSAIAVASGVNVERWWMVRACDAPADGGMLPRWLCCAELSTDGEDIVAISAHAPPPRYSELTPGFNAQVAKVVSQYPNRSVVGADANQDIDQFARALGSSMRAVGKQSGICLVSALPMSDVLLDGWGESQNMTDHPAVGATVGDTT